VEESVHAPDDGGRFAILIDGEPLFEFEELLASWAGERG
jgi:hypothetical protein